MIYGYLIVGIIGILVYFLFVSKRYSNNINSVKRADYIIKQISENPMAARDLSVQLDILYSTKKILWNNSLNTIFSNVNENFSYDNLVFSLKTSIEENIYLCIIKYFYEDFDVKSINGELGVTKNVAQYNFLVRKNVDKMQYECYSDLYEDLSDKNRRIEVANILLKFLE